MPSSHAASPHDGAFRYDDPYDYKNDEDYVHADRARRSSGSGRSSASRAARRPRPVEQDSSGETTDSEEERELEKELYDIDAPRSKWTMHSQSKMSQSGRSHRYHELAKQEDDLEQGSPPAKKKSKSRLAAAGAPPDDFRSSTQTAPRHPRKWIYITIAIVVILAVIGLVVGIMWRNGTFSKMGSASESEHSSNSTSTASNSASAVVQTGHGPVRSTQAQGSTGAQASSAATPSTASYDNGLYHPAASSQGTTGQATASQSLSLDWNTAPSSQASPSAASSLQWGSVETQSAQGSSGQLVAPATQANGQSQSSIAWGGMVYPTTATTQASPTEGIMSIQTVPNPSSDSTHKSTLTNPWLAAGVTMSDKMATDALTTSPSRTGNPWQEVAPTTPPGMGQAPWNQGNPQASGLGQEDGSWHQPSPSPTQQWPGQQPQGQQWQGQPSQPQHWQGQQSPDQSSQSQQWQGQQDQPSSGQQWQGQQQDQPSQGQQNQGQQPQWQQQAPAKGAFAWQTLSGAATWYEADQHFGQCKVAVKDTDWVVSVSQDYFASFADPSKVCLQEVTITNMENSQTVKAWVADSCAYCQGEYSLDLSKTVFAALNGGDLNKGVLQVSWGFTKQNSTESGGQGQVGGSSPTAMATMTAGSAQASQKSGASTLTSSKSDDNGWSWPWEHSS